MYNEFYGFAEKPFSIVPNPAFLYMSKKHKMAMTYLKYGLMEGSGFILLTGEIGTGKTTLIRRLMTGLSPDTNVAVIFNTNVDPEELLKLILQEFEITPRGNDKSANLELLNDYLIKVYGQGRRALLIIDEAQNLSAGSMEEVRMLSNLQTETQSLLQICLVGQPELKQRIRGPGLAQLAQRVTVSFHLQTLTLPETAAYIEYRVKKAGRQGEPLFTEQAIGLIHRRSGGTPRAINILCDAALVYGFADEAKVIDRDIVEQVIKDRDSEGAVAATAMSDQGEPLPDNGAAALPGPGDSELASRLRNLEARMEKVAAQVDWQTNELRERLDAGKDAVAAKLEQLLVRERERNRQLVTRCAGLEAKLKDIEGRQVEPGQPDQEEDKPRKGLKGWLRGQ